MILINVDFVVVVTVLASASGMYGTKSVQLLGSYKFTIWNGSSLFPCLK